MRVLAASVHGQVYAAIGSRLCAVLDYPVHFEELTEAEVLEAKNDGCVWRTVNGRRVCIKPKGTADERAARALDTHKVVDKAKFAAARAGELKVIAALGHEASPSGDTKPLDVYYRRGSAFHALEVKTMVDQRNDKITMHPWSRRRKESWGKKNGAGLHTVVVDSRSGRYYSGNQLYYKRGVGSFRLGSMTPVRDAAHLKRLISE